MAACTASHAAPSAARVEQVVPRWQVLVIELEMFVLLACRAVAAAHTAAVEPAAVAWGHFFANTGTIFVFLQAWRV